MKEVLIRLGAMAPAQVSWAEVAENGTVRTGQGSLAQAAELVDQHRVSVLVPGQDVLLVSARIPGGNRKRMIQAVPYALEEHYIADRDTLHFALGRTAADGTVPVAVVDVETLDGWLAMLAAAAIEPDRMVPDILALPWAEGSRTLVVEESLVMVRTGPQGGFVLDPENVETILPQAGEEDAAIRCYVCGGTLPESFDAATEAVEISEEPYGAMALLARGWNGRETIDLLQGRYNRHAEWGKLWERWRFGVVLLVLFIGLQTVLWGADYRSLRRESSRLTGQIEEVYRQAFPDTKKVVNPRAQMEQQLAVLRGGGQGPGDFLRLLEQASPLLLATGGFQLQGLRYKDGRMDLDFQVGSLQALDDLKKRLSEGAGLEVEIRSATSKEEIVEARIQVRGGRP